MNTKFLVAFLAAASLSGCVISTGGGGGGGGGTVGTPGDVTFLLTFDGGYSCAGVPDVQMIKISIVGESLVNDGAFVPCSDAILLQGFAPKSYSFTIEAFGYGSDRLFVSSNIFAVNGDVTVHVDLQPAVGAPSYAYIGWGFPPNHLSTNPSCAEVGASQVQVRIDDGLWVSYPCASGNSSWLLTDALDAGPHWVDLRVVGGDGTVYFQTEGTFTTYVGFTEYYPFAMSWAVGVLGVRTQLWNGASTISCTNAGISKLYVSMYDSWNNYIPDLQGQFCDPQWVYNYRYVPAGTYDVYVTDGLYTPYYSSQTYTGVTVATGLYTVLDADVDRVR
jgi:hypothetical protein